MLLIYVLEERELSPEGVGVPPGGIEIYIWGVEVYLWGGMEHHPLPPVNIRWPGKKMNF